MTRRYAMALHYYHHYVASATSADDIVKRTRHHCHARTDTQEKHMKEMRAVICYVVLRHAFRAMACWHCHTAALSEADTLMPMIMALTTPRHRERHYYASADFAPLRYATTITR